MALGKGQDLWGRSGKDALELLLSILASCWDSSPHSTTRDLMGYSGQGKGASTFREAYASQEPCVGLYKVPGSNPSSATPNPRSKQHLEQIDSLPSLSFLHCNMYVDPLTS